MAHTDDEDKLEAFSLNYTLFINFCDNIQILFFKLNCFKYKINEKKIIFDAYNSTHLILNVRYIILFVYIKL